MTLSAARSAAAAHHGDIAKGVDIATVRRSAKAAAGVKAITLADAFERFLTLKDRRSSTTRRLQAALAFASASSLKRKSLGDVTPFDIEKLKTELGRKTPRTANKVIVLLSAIMSKSGRWADNPARGIERFEELFARVDLMPTSWGGSGRRLTLPGEACGRTSSNY